MSDTVSLARAQRVLARAFGFADWAALRAHLATIERFSRSFDEPTDADLRDRNAYEVAVRRGGPRRPACSPPPVARATGSGPSSDAGTG